MTHIELSEKGLHNRHIEFSYKGEILSGVLIDMIPYDEKNEHTEYMFIPSENRTLWKEAFEKKDFSLLNNFFKTIDIQVITNGRQLPF